MLRDILEAVGTTSIFFEDKLVRTEYLENLKNRINSTELPLRKVQIFNRPDALPEQEIAFMTCQNSILVSSEWTVSDLFFYKAAAAGLGLKEAEPYLVEYVDSYIRVLGNNFSPITIANSELRSFSFSVGMLEWPEVSGERYFGVTVNLQFREHYL